MANQELIVIYSFNYEVTVYKYQMERLTQLGTIGLELVGTTSYKLTRDTLRGSRRIKYKVRENK